MGRMTKLVLAGALMIVLTAGIAAAQSTQAIQSCEEFSDGQREQCNGSPGDDQIFESGTFSSLLGGPGGEGINDNIFARAGSDFVDASLFGDDRDKVYAGKGNDDIDTADGDGRDFIDCGPGTDEANIDPGDRTRDCDGNVSTGGGE